MPTQFSFGVESEEDGQRLDVFLVGRLDDTSRARVQKLIHSGLVTVDGQPVLPRAIVHAGQQVQGTTELHDEWSVQPEDIPLDIVHEDKWLAVVNKPRGLAVHPGAGRPSGTLVNALAHKYGELPAGSAGERPGIVHRLDMDTSGLMLVALRPESMTALAAMIAGREVDRRYQVLVWGDPRWEQAVVDAAIGRDPKHPERMAVLPRKGPSPARQAVTELTAVERFGETTLLEAKLQTGRTHQIRVHCAYAGHDVVGDPVYGRKHRLKDGGSRGEEELARLLDALDGQALHAARLAFAHPMTHKALEFEAPIPPVMEEVAGFFRERAGRG